MKRAVCIAIVLMFFATPCFAWYDIIEKGKDYIVVKIEKRNELVRLWKCGKIEVMEWKEVRKNQETSNGLIIYTPQTFTVPNDGVYLNNTFTN